MPELASRECERPESGSGLRPNGVTDNSRGEASAESGTPGPDANKIISPEPCKRRQHSGTPDSFLELHWNNPEMRSTADQGPSSVGLSPGRRGFFGIRALISPARLTKEAHHASGTLP